jgi:hypothetical protein
MNGEVYRIAFAATTRHIERALGSKTYQRVVRGVILAVPGKVAMPTVEAELTRLEARREGMAGDAVELRRKPFGKALEKLGAVDMACFPGELAVSRG